MEENNIKENCMEINLNEALAMIKVLDKKIDKKLDEARFITYARKNNDNTIKSTKKELFCDDAKSAYDSIVTYMEQLKYIKGAVFKENTAHTITLPSGQKYTIADALQRKKDIELEKMLLEKMKDQYYTAMNALEQENRSIQSECDKQIASIYNLDKNSDKNKDKSATENISKFREEFMSTHEFEAVDPLKLKEKIAMLEDNIIEFEAFVDNKIFEANMSIKIEVPNNLVNPMDLVDMKSGKNKRKTTRKK